jgi:hypothetical protein
MAKLRLNLACWNYDRTRALADGSVQPNGIDLNYLDLPVEETFFRMLRYREFEVAELSLSSYTVSLFGEQQPFIAIPVFPSRFFPALVLLRQRRRQHPHAEGLDRQTYRHARIPDDCAGLDPWDPVRALTVFPSTTSLTSPAEKRSRNGRKRSRVARKRQGSGSRPLSIAV